MALRTRAAVAGRTFSESLIVRETVAVETFALLATSLMFMQVHEEGSGGELHSSNDCGAKELRMQARASDRLSGAVSACIVSVYRNGFMLDNAALDLRQRLTIAGEPWTDATWTDATS